MHTSTIVLKRPPQGSLRFGHPWIYKNQIREVSMGIEPGDIVSVTTESGKFLGRGYWNPKSEISIRLLTRLDEPIDRAWMARTMSEALRGRQSQQIPGRNAYRLISSEADQIPGLIIDRYADVLVLQCLTLGIDRLKPLIIEALRDLISPKGIFERSDSSVRKLEGLESRVGWVEKNRGDECLVHEGSLEIAVRFEAGHKTGWYLDQAENRVAMTRWAAKGARALDVFCYEGGFGLHLAKAGMTVLGIDSQQDVLDRAAEHRGRNKISETALSFRQANAFEALKDLEKAGEKYDLIILDPPSFVKQKSALAGAMSGYKEILQRSFKMLGPAGKLAVFSCAYHLDDTFLMQASLSAAQDTRRPVRLLQFFKQASDHPILPFIPETYYLKGYLFELCPN